MKAEKYAIINTIMPEELKQIRKVFNLSQSEFAKLVGVSKPTIERWERGEEKIKGPVAVLVNMLSENPAYLKSRIVPEKQMPLRLFYMYKNRVCTLIDVDENKEEVLIKNYTNNVMFKAFGINESPTFKDYQEFLKSRCFPESRDKLKLVLEDLGLPFYDPFLIIKKTEGRMAEDDFWIKIEE